MMYWWVVWSFLSLIEAAHFNGGTIRWFPTDPYGNGESVSITIVQSYYWSYPSIECTEDVPIETIGRGGDNTNLTCVAECTGAGGYEYNPVDILTDCLYVSSAMGFMASERSVTIALNPESYFYLGHMGSPWRGLNNDDQNDLEWSMVTLINLKTREDGSINTPPSASVVSPQYVIVNTIAEIKIPISDPDQSNDVRCRWSQYKPGYRRRKRESLTCEDCKNSCEQDCPCECESCQWTTCTGSTCKTSTCPMIPTTTTTTTLDTRGALRSTSSYANAPAIDECGDICYPHQLPNGTTLSDCTLSIRGLIEDTWYAVAIQVEDFIDTTSTDPLSSVPVQFLIYVMRTPVCLQLPVILPLEGCLEIQVGITKTFNITVLNYCDGETASIQEMLISKTVAGLEADDLMVSSENGSLAYTTYLWTPLEEQIGLQQLCFIAYTTERAQSQEYCVIFFVTNASTICETTTLSTTSVSPGRNSSETSTIGMSSLTMTTTASGKPVSWGLIGGLISLILPLGLLSALWLYRLLQTPSAQLRLQQEDGFQSIETRTTVQKTSTEADAATNPIAIPNKSYQIYNIETNQNQQQNQTSQSGIGSLTLMDTSVDTPTQQESFVSFSTTSFDPTQSNLSQWSTGNMSNSKQPLMSSARRYLYGFNTNKVSQS